MRISLTLVVASFLAMPFWIQAAEVVVQPGSLDGVSIESADISRNLEGSRRELVVRFRNNGIETGQAVTLAAVVRDKNGHAKGLSANQITVDVSPGRVQAVSQPLPSYLEEADSVTLQLVDIDASPADLSL